MRSLYTQTYTRIDDAIIDSPTARKLGISARLLLFELIRVFARTSKVNSLLDGTIKPIRFGPANVRNTMSRSTYHRARAELEIAGFITVQTREGITMIRWVWTPTVVNFIAPTAQNEHNPVLNDDTPPAQNDYTPVRNFDRHPLPPREITPPHARSVGTKWDDF